MRFGGLIFREPLIFGGVSYRNFMVFDYAQCKLLSLYDVPRPGMPCEEYRDYVTRKKHSSG